MNPTTQDVIRAVEQVVAANDGRAYLSEPVNNSYVHTALMVMAQTCGVLTPAAMTDAELVQLYSVARSKPATAIAMSIRINQKYATPSLVDPVATYVKPRAPTPAVTAPGISAAEIARMIADAVEPVARDAEAARGAIDVLGRDIMGLARDEASRAAIAAVEAALATITPTTLVVEMPAAAPVALGLVHFKTADIIKALSARLNVYLHGPAGSGKTTVGRKAAQALGVQFYCAAKVESEYLLLGFKDARGETVRTQFREAYEHGGLFLFDEMDASAAGAVVALNMALANGECAFPDGIVQQHKDCYIIGAGNTTLGGANRQYVGRSQMDAATVDRFAFIHFPYDEALELALATHKGWGQHVQAVRKAVADRGIAHLVTPRATLDGCKALAAGFSWEEAETMHVYKGLEQDTVDQLRRSVVRPMANVA